MRDLFIFEYKSDVKYCVVCGRDCLQDERRVIPVDIALYRKDYYICDCCYNDARREEVVPMRARK